MAAANEDEESVAVARAPACGGESGGLVSGEYAYGAVVDECDMWRAA
jgi:hypothetical protein